MTLPWGINSSSITNVVPIGILSCDKIGKIGGVSIAQGGKGQPAFYLRRTRVESFVTGSISSSVLVRSKPLRFACKS